MLILDLHMVINLDSTCLDTLEGLHRSGFLEKLGAENLLPDLPAALGRARPRSAAAKGLIA